MTSKRVPDMRAPVLSDNFTLARLVLAGMVLFSHSFAMVGQDEPMLLGRSVGSAAVHGFFVISGYLVTGSFQNAGPAAFVFRRVLRITPGYLLGYGLGAICLILFNGYAGNPIPGIGDGPLWTISWEILMYVGVFTAGVFALLRAETIGTIFLVAILLACIHLHDSNPGNNVIAPLAILFLGGAFLQVQKESLPRWLYLTSALLMAVCFVPGLQSVAIRVMGSFSFGFSWGINAYEVRYLLYLLLFPAAVLYACRFAPVSIMVPADYSYGVYVFAWPIQCVLVSLSLQYAGHVPSPGVLFITAGGISLLLAALSWHLVEKPVLRLKKYVGAIGPWQNSDGQALGADDGPTKRSSIDSRASSIGR